MVFQILSYSSLLFSVGGLAVFMLTGEPFSSGLFFGGLIFFGVFRALGSIVNSLATIAENSAKTD